MLENGFEMLRRDGWILMREEEFMRLVEYIAPGRRYWLQEESNESESESDE